ncbi:hypothetical protein ETU09_01185 [Apibacter muscae]|uniref:Uncharacterized protein n=1 Tax=Apibacter muscae TaxID=2509004 RepID=A0A563DL81_9FLAO|nr:hypothetical protein [Apibacter muscae]TWP30643.1 hypothetical protein ETU09_01185 [Apibacter muscae]
MKDLGIVFFYAMIAFFVIFIICGLITMVLSEIGNKAKQTWLKITLISLLLSGVSLLLTSILCGWLR